MAKSVATFAASVVAGACWLGAAQAARPQAPPPDPTAMDGQYLFDTYCAPCHGRNGKGEGSVSVALKVPPPDLTGLTQRHSGVFPRARVERFVADGTGDFGSPHAPGRMPRWGPTFLSFDPSDARARQRIASIVGHVEVLQSEVRIASGPLSHRVVTDALFHIDGLWMRVAPGSLFQRWLSTGAGKRATITLTTDAHRFDDKPNVRVLTGTLNRSIGPSERPIVHLLFLKDDATGALGPVTLETTDPEIARRFGPRDNMIASLVVQIRQ